MEGHIHGFPPFNPFLISDANTITPPPPTVNGQISEVQLMQQHLYELETRHTKMAQQ